MLKSILIVFVFLMSAGVVYAGKCSGGPGAIWVMHENGSKDDYFYPGEDVYLGGHNFEANKDYYYYITDRDENSSTYKEVVKDGYVATDGDGNIPQTYIWTIPADDYVGHEYRVDLVYNKCYHKVWTKKDSFEVIPEFPTVAVPAILSLGGYLALKIRKKYK